MTSPVLEVLRFADRIEFMDPVSGGSIRFEAVTPSPRGLNAWVELRLRGEDRPAAFGRCDLMAARTSSILLSGLNGQLRAAPWESIIREGLYRVVRAELDGDAPTRLSDISGTTHKWCLAPLIEGIGATMLVAGGGSGKSYLALACAVSIATGRSLVGGLTPETVGPVVYLDWEADAEEHARRLRRICRGAGISADGVDVFYRRETSLISRGAQAIAKIVDEHDAVLAVVDSMMLARGGDSFGSADTVAVFRALREIGCPALVIDHKTRASISAKRKGAYGSIVGENSARRVWELTQTDQGPNVKTVRLQNTKANNSMNAQPITFQLTWSERPEPTIVMRRSKSSEAAYSAGSDSTKSLWAAIAMVLSASDTPITVADIRTGVALRGLETSEGSIRKMLSRHPGEVENIGSRALGQWTIKGAT